MRLNRVNSHLQACGDGSAVCIKCLGRHPAVQHALDAAERAAIHDCRRLLTAAPGARLFKRSERIVIAHLAKGILKLTPLGDETQIAGVLFAPEIVTPGDLRNFRVYAQSDCQICCFDEAAIKTIFGHYPHLAESFWQHSLDSLSGLRRDSSLLNAANATHRVAALLWIVARREQATTEAADGAQQATDEREQGAAEDHRSAAAPQRGVQRRAEAKVLPEEGAETTETAEFVLPMTLASAATLLGLAAETVSRCIGVLQDAGLVRKLGRRRYAVPNLGRLREFVAVE